MKIFLNRFLNRLRESLALALLGDGSFNRVSIFVRLFFRLRWRPIGMHLRAHGIPFLFEVSTHEELMLLYEIFCRRMYDFSYVHNVEYVVDCGANSGVSTLFLFTLFPHARILAVEPNPALFPKLVKNVLPYKNITPIHCAVGGNDGTASFFVSPHTTVASSMVRRTAYDREYTVTVKTLEKLMHEYDFPKIDALKFDIEGAEHELFSHLTMLKAVGSFSGEVHEDLMNASVADFMRLFAGRFHTSLTPTGKKGRYIIHGHTSYDN